LLKFFSTSISVVHTNNVVDAPPGSEEGQQEINLQTRLKEKENYKDV
jgi:hypothetical protein